jgi:hypothetical protein
VQLKILLVDFKNYPNPKIMSAGESMDASVLMQKLVEREINTQLLIEFYEEVVENEKIFCEMVETISNPDDIEERQRCMEHIEKFCMILRDLQIEYEGLLDNEKIFTSDVAKREDMINNASRFIDMLEKDCNIQFPSDIS